MRIFKVFFVLNVLCCQIAFGQCYPTGFQNPQVRPVPGVPFDFANCQIKLEIGNPQRGVTYTWLNALNGPITRSFATYGNGVFTSEIYAEDACGNDQIFKTPFNGGNTRLSTYVASEPQIIGCSQYIVVTATVCIPVDPSIWFFLPLGLPSDVYIFNRTSTSCSALYVSQLKGSELSQRYIQYGVYSYPTDIAYTYSLVNLLPKPANCLSKEDVNTTSLRTKVSNDEALANVKKINDLFSLSLTNDFFEKNKPVQFSDNEFSKFNTQSSNANNFNVYPNPTNNDFRIGRLIDIEKVKILNVQGKVLHTNKIAEGQTELTISTSDFPDGLYFVQIIDKFGKLQTEKVTVQR